MQRHSLLEQTRDNGQGPNANSLCGTVYCFNPNAAMINALLLVKLTLSMLRKSASMN